VQLHRDAVLTKGLDGISGNMATIEGHTGLGLHGGDDVRVRDGSEQATFRPRPVWPSIVAILPLIPSRPLVSTASR
jgi:hypothetical protein